MMRRRDICRLQRLDARSGSQLSEPVTCWTASTSGKVVIKNGVETWQAYNTWGGYDLYNGPGGTADYSNRSLAVNLDRPYDANGPAMFPFHERANIGLGARAGLPRPYRTRIRIDRCPAPAARAGAEVPAGPQAEP